MKYLDQATIDDARNAYGFGVPLNVIAGRLQITVGELRNALGLIPLKRDPPRLISETASNHFDQLSGGTDDENL